MTKLSLLFVACCALAPAVLLVACTTDNGDAVHGPQFGPPPERPDGTSDGNVSEQDGGPTPGEDGGADASDAAMPPACTNGTVVVLAGTDTALTGATQLKGGAWSGAPIAGGAAQSAPSIVAIGTGFAALTRGAGNALQSLTYENSWSAPTAIGTLTTLGTPALTVLGTKAQSVFLSGGADANKFFRIENGGTSWTTTGDPVGSPQSFGPSAGTIAAAGADLVFAQNGSDNGLYTQKWDGAWAAADPIGGAGTLPSAPPALLAVDGTFDLVLLYVGKDAPNVIGYATRNATTKLWSTTPLVTHAMAQTASQMSLARISAFVVMATYIGNNGRPYYMTGTLGVSAISWSQPAQLLADNSMVAAAPALAKGVCGDDAVAVFSSAGQVKATRYRGTVWTVPETVSGASGSQVSVATR